MVHMGLTGLSIWNKSGDWIDNLRIFDSMTNKTDFYFDLLLSLYCQIMKSCIYNTRTIIKYFDNYSNPILILVQ